MAQPRKILLADPDLESVRALTRALRERGYQVHYAPDGSRALELSVLRHPDLTLFDEACPLIDARTFVSILRSNPRTEDIPVVLTTRALDADRLRGLRDGYLQKPFNLDEVLSRIEHLVRRSEAAKDLKGEAREIEGQLGQLGVADVLQILAMNRRTGRLELRRQSESGEIQVGEGRPLNARSGAIEGEKALFRLLTWTEGAFAFVPGAPTGRVRIARGMDDALLEGMRQKDEGERLWSQLPPRTVRLQIAAHAEVSEAQHPVTAQVLELVHQPRTLSELLDLSPATDLDTAQALYTLLDKGLVTQVDGESSPPAPVLGPAEAHALRSRLLHGRANTRAAVAKVLLVGPSLTSFARLRAELPGFLPASAEPEAARSGFGTLGRVEVSEALHVDFCTLPLADVARPLWRPFCTNSVGALVLDTQSESLGLAEFLASDIRTPLVVMGAKVPTSLQDATAGVVAVSGDLGLAVRTLLVQALHPGAVLPPASPAS